MVTAQQTTDFERLMRQMNPNGAENEEFITLLDAIFSDNADNVSVLGGSEAKAVAADFDINNTVTLADIPGLESSSLAAGTKYLVEVFLIVTGASITPDLDLKFISSANSTLDWALGASVDASAAELTIATEKTVPVGAATGTVKITGVLNIVDTAGTVKLQAAQNVATAENTTIKAGSTMSIKRIE